MSYVQELMESGGWIAVIIVLGAFWIFGLGPIFAPLWELELTRRLKTWYKSRRT